MPRFFDLSFHELLAAKHPTAWVEFEKAQITEQQLFDKFFQDGRGFDGPALVEHMVRRRARPVQDPQRAHALPAGSPRPGVPAGGRFAAPLPALCAALCAKTKPPGPWPAFSPPTPPPPPTHTPTQPNLQPNLQPNPQPNQTSLSPSATPQIAHYSYVDGMAPLLARLRDAGYAMHAMSNYPEWWRHIEAKLAVSDFMQWSFVSCEGPMKVGGGCVRV